MMDPTDVTPLNIDPSTVTDPVRERVHRRRCDAQHAADDARSQVLGALLDGGTRPDVAAGLVDGLIATVRTADAFRLQYAIGVQRDDAPGMWWPGVSGVNEAVDFLHKSTTAYPVHR